MYNYRIGGKTGKVQKLEISDDRVAVRTQNARALNDALFDPKSKETLQEFDVEQYLPNTEVTVLKVKSNIINKKASRDAVEVEKLFRGQPQVLRHQRPGLHQRGDEQAILHRDEGQGRQQRDRETLRSRQAGQPRGQTPAQG